MKIYKIVYKQINYVIYLFEYIILISNRNERNVIKNDCEFEIINFKKNDLVMMRLWKKCSLLQLLWNGNIYSNKNINLKEDLELNQTLYMKNQITIN